MRDRVLRRAVGGNAGGPFLWRALLDSFQRDSDTILSILRLLLARDNISSEMVDNTNGLIVMRSYLTTLFFIDKVIIVDSS